MSSLFALFAGGSSNLLELSLISRMDFLAWRGFGLWTISSSPLLSELSPEPSPSVKKEKRKLNHTVDHEYFVLKIFRFRKFHCNLFLWLTTFAIIIILYVCVDKRTKFILNFRGFH